MDLDFICDDRYSDLPTSVIIAICFAIEEHNDYLSAWYENFIPTLD